MKRILLLLPLLLIGAIIWAMLPIKLSVPAGDGAKLPPFNPRATLKVSLINTATMTANKSFGYRGGNPLEAYTTNVIAVLLEHPKGRFLFDAGIASNGQKHLENHTPYLMQALAELDLIASTADQLARAGIAPNSIEGVFLSHTHWDHISGMADLANVPVWITQTEFNDIDSGADAVQLAAALKPGLTFELYTFDDGPYAGFAQSYDIYGDESAVLVPLPGHTADHVGLFVNLASGTRLFFIGDLAWVKEGIERPAERPLLPRTIADKNPSLVADTLITVHKLAKANPELIIVPAHDARVHQHLAQFPAFEQ